MCSPRHAALAAISVNYLFSIANAQQSGRTSEPSRLRESVTGPTRTMNEGIAAGATAIVTLQPVAPKTVPASNYPPGSAIMGATLMLGSVPARVWIETHVTGWAPDVLKNFEVAIDALDVDNDGRG